MSEHSWEILQGPTALHCPRGGEPMRLIEAHDSSGRSVGIAVWRCVNHGKFFEDGEHIWEGADDE